MPVYPDKLLNSAASLAHGLEIHRHSLDVDDRFIWELHSKSDRLRDAFHPAEQARQTRASAAHKVAVADEALKAWLTKARLVVMLARGAKWSEAWIHTGFADRNNNVPKHLEGRLSLSRALVIFFARHPELGVPFAEVTAARGRAIYERAAQSYEMLELAKQDCAVIDGHRKLAEKDLRYTVRRIVVTLKSQMRNSDPRWMEFGIVQSTTGKHSGLRAAVTSSAQVPLRQRSESRAGRVVAA